MITCVKTFRHKGSLWEHSRNCKHSFLICTSAKCIPLPLSSRSRFPLSHPSHLTPSFSFLLYHVPILFLPLCTVSQAPSLLSSYSLSPSFSLFPSLTSRPESVWQSQDELTTFIVLFQRRGWKDERLVWESGGGRSGSYNCIAKVRECVRMFVCVRTQCVCKFVCRSECVCVCVETAIHMTQLLPLTIKGRSGAVTGLTASLNRHWGRLQLYVCACVCVCVSMWVT